MEADLVIADLTEHNPKVMFESGVFLCQALSCCAVAVELVVIHEPDPDVRTAMIGDKGQVGFGRHHFLAPLVKQDTYTSRVSGVRTPWTLANDRVWQATHRFAAKTLVVAGLIGSIAVAVKGWVVFGVVALGASLLLPAVYSLVLYGRLSNREER